jgi:hypothetical protein
VKEKLFVFLTVLLAAVRSVWHVRAAGHRQYCERPPQYESGPFGYQGLWRWLAAEKIAHRVSGPLLRARGSKASARGPGSRH